MNYLRLIIAAVLPVAASGMFYILDTKTSFSKLSLALRQLLIGLVFGALACFSTMFSVEVGGAATNVRDAAPLCAGLIFGSPAGLIAGVLGGVFRWIATPVFGIGSYTRLGCSLATCFAGVIGAVLRKYLFDDKCPSFGYGLAIGTATEVLHMLIIFLTNMNDIKTAFTFISKCTPPMVILNAIALSASLLCISLMSKRKLFSRHKERALSSSFQYWLLVVVFVGFIISSVFTSVIQTSIANTKAEELLTLGIDDIKSDLSELANTDDRELIGLLTKYHHLETDGCIIIADHNGNIVSDRNGHLGNTLSDVGLPSQSISNYSRFTAFVHDRECFCMCYTEPVDGYTIFASIPVEEVMLSRDLSSYVTMFMEVVVFSALFICVYFLIKTLVVDNIHEVNDSLAKITGGNLDVTVDVRSNIEFASLSDDINSTVSTLKQYIAEAAARIDKELEFAKAIQLSVLPNTFPPFPERSDIDIFARMDTAKEVGGDFYDFYLVAPDTLAVLVADVSGKGIPAAMFMMTAKATIKNLAQSNLTPEEVFTRANAKLCEGNDAGMFVTAWMAFINLKTGSGVFANAGHNPPLIRHKDGSYEYLRSRAGLVLAGMDGIKYHSNELTLLPGDSLFLYTDGVTEATDPENRLYGEERLQSFLNSLQPCSAEEVCLKVKADVDRFAREAPQFDDITMLCLKLK